MYQLINGIFKDPNDQTRVTLVWGINNERDAIFKKEFQRLEKRFPGRFRVVWTVSHPDREAKEGSRKGYVTKELLGSVLKEEGKTEKVFVCGPPAMEKSLTGGRRGDGGVLGALGYGKDEVFKF